MICNFSPRVVTALAVLLTEAIASQSTVVETAPEFVVSGDFNADGEKDLAIVHGNSSVGDDLNVDFE